MSQTLTRLSFGKPIRDALRRTMRSLSIPRVPRSTMALSPAARLLYRHRLLRKTLSAVADLRRRLEIELFSTEEMQIISLARLTYK